MATLTVRLLGEFRVDELELGMLGSRKARQLLRLLALARGRFVGIDALAEALWGDELPARPGDQLAVLVSRLRRQLGADRVVRGDEGYRLRYDWLDVDELESVVAEAERRHDAGRLPPAAAAARIALSLIRGAPSTAGIDVEWAGREVSAIQALIGKARRVAAGVLVESGHWLDAVEILRTDIEREPYDEDAVRLLMQAEVAAGRPGAALAAYADLRERLADELGTEPASATAALHLAVLRGELGGRPLDGRKKPGDAGRLVGRDAELGRLDRLADEGRIGGGHVSGGHVSGTVIVGVIGEAGIGKTSVLRAWQRRRAALGDTLLAGTCGPLERSVPLDAVVVALGDYLRRLELAQADAVLGPEAAMLRPLLVGRLRGDRAEPLLADRDLGPAVLFAALVAVLARIAAHDRLLLVLDDAHLAGPALVEWLRFAQRRQLPMLVVVAARPDEGVPLPITTTIMLGPLDAAATAELVGPDRAKELYDRSLGHPLFLSELAAGGAGDDLPPSLLAAVSARCDELGTAGTLLRSAAVLGSRLDVELLAAVLHRPALRVLDDAELAARRGLLVDDAGLFGFRHELVRAALAAGTSVGRSALLHREAGRALAGRQDADPLQVAEHARIGGDLALAARALRAAAVRAGERFDHAAAEELLDQAVRLHPDTEGWLGRARVRTRRGDYDAALRDVQRARAAGAAALEVGAWAAYFGRHFDDAARYAEDGALSAADPDVRVRCQIVGGRTRHAQGNLAEAERMLLAALSDARGADRVIASAWLGVLRSHQSRATEAMALLRPAVTAHVGVEHTAATLHALLFTGHAHALDGRPAAALDAFERYSQEVRRRHVPRFSGRGVNFAGWVLRNLGAVDAGLDRHVQALAAADDAGTLEVRIAALQDFADERLTAGDPDGAAAQLRAADQAAVGDLVFGWRLAMKSQLLHARHALCIGADEDALDRATRLAGEAQRAGVPRYATVARLLTHRARRRLGLPVDLDAVDRDLAAATAAVAVEAWWWTGDTAAEFGVATWLHRAAADVRRLTEQAGPWADTLCRDADRRLAQWRLTVR